MGEEIKWGGQRYCQPLDRFRGVFRILSVVENGSLAHIICDQKHFGIRYIDLVILLQKIT